MIKKFIKWLFWLFVLWFCFINFSNAVYQLFPVDLDKSQSYWDDQYNIWFLPKWRFLTMYLWTSKSVIALDNTQFIWWARDWLYYYWPDVCLSNMCVPFQWYFQYFTTCDEIILDWSWDTIIQNCSALQKFDLWDDVLWNFINTIKYWDFVYIDDDWWIWWCGWYCQYAWSSKRICWSSSQVWQSVCFIGGVSTVWNNYWPWVPLKWSIWFSDLTFAKLPIGYIFLDPPWVDNNYDPDITETFSTWNTQLIPTWIDEYVSYYEDEYNWDENMCYVWTNDLDSLFWANWIEFEFWSWATIFSLYYHLYNDFWSNSVHNVWAFVNTWLLDYASWFETASDERLYMARYNWPDQNVTYDYTWFTFPFANNPVAIYFMADLLSNQYIKESSQWEEIAFYCNMKLNYDNYKNDSLDFNELLDQVDPKIKNVIESYNDRRFGRSDWYSIPDMSSWSIWDWLVKTWYNIPEDLNPTSLFKDYFDKIDWLLRWFNPVSSNWILPWWILYPMLFLVLFRILRH